MKKQKAKAQNRRRNQRRWKRSVARRHAAKLHAPVPQDDPIYLNIPPLAKLSETILDYAEPLLNDADNEHDMRAGINAAISFWNLSMLEEQEARKTLVSQMDESLVDGSAERTQLLEMFDWMYRRKQDFFAHDSRLVTAHEFSKTSEGRYHLNVMGVFTEPGPNPPIEATP